MKRRFEETNRLEGAGKRVVVAGLERRTTTVSVVGSTKRKNSPTCGSGRGSLIRVLPAAAKPPGNAVNIARRVMPVTTNWKMRIRNPPLQSKPQIVLHWMRCLRIFRFCQILVGIHRHAAQANLVMYVGRSHAAGCAGESYDLSEPDFLPGDDKPLRKMGVIRLKSIAVVDDNQFPVASAPASAQDNAVG